MSRRNLRYTVNGRTVSRLEAIAFYTKLAKNYKEPEKGAFIALISAEFENDQLMDRAKSNFQTIVVPLIGVVLLLFSVYMAFIVPHPSKYQSGVFWVLLSIAAAMSAVMITGNIEFSYSPFIKAGGAIAIFCFMYFFVPSIYEETRDSTTRNLSIFAVTSDSTGMRKIDVNLERNESDKVTDMAGRMLSKYLGLNINAVNYTCFSMSDGKIYTTESCREIDDNGILMVSDSVSKKFPDKRQEYMHYKPIMDSLSRQ